MVRLPVTPWLFRCLFAAAAISVIPSSSAQIVIEAEDAVVNREALQDNVSGKQNWNLWSTDKDRFKKWSQGVVIQGPAVKQDRESPEEGAPVLHLVINNVPEGDYDIELEIGRVLGISFDGKTWQRCTGGTVKRMQRLGDKPVEFWIDDRYAVEAEAGRGSGYLDTITLYRCVAIENGVGNPGFEEIVSGDQAAAWSWHSRDRQGAAIVTEEDAHTGNRAVHITYAGDNDWTYTCGTRLPATPGTGLCLRAWIRGASNQNPVAIDAVGTTDRTGASRQLGHRFGKPTGEWQMVQAYFTVVGDVNEVQVRFMGSGKAELFVDDVSLTEEVAPVPKMPKITGWAATRVEEAMGRGVIALPRPDGSAYIGWRLLKADPANIAFDIYRSIGGRPAEKINTAPIVQTTDFTDIPPKGLQPVYTVRPTPPFQGAGGEATLQTCPEGAEPFIAIKLQAAGTKVQKVGIADLNGDGVYDYVIKYPNDNIDPWVKYWKPSPDTYKLGGYLADGTFLWQIDLGWGIERGIWYSPYLVYDLTGDGKAEIAAKIGEGDPRNADGQVDSGPEWLVVWDGMSGKEISRVPWPAREGFDSYNHASRNQIAVAYLDGKTPCLLALRGTYGRMKVDAYMLKDNQLQPLWQYDNEELDGRYRGQGAHFTLAADVDGDGRDEVILGSAVLDDTGAPLWSTGRGHPDGVYISDIDPTVPGLEISYNLETAQRRGGGLNVVSAATGKQLWQLSDNTSHVHSKGMCADIDPVVPGMEIYGADANGHTLTDHRWLFAADGTLLRSGTDCPWGFTVATVWWDGDLQKELAGNRIADYGGAQLTGKIDGSVVIQADVLGDWREEIITSVAGELRIYSSTIPAMDRRVCLMQDPIYRLGTCMNAMGYTQTPTLSYNPEATAPNLNLSFVTAAGQQPYCQLVVSAPVTAALNGALALRPPAGLTTTPASLQVALKPGGRLVQTIQLHAEAGARIDGYLTAELHTDRAVLTGRTPVQLGKPSAKAAKE